MENYVPEWRNKDDIADAIRRARPMFVDTDELRRASIECRHRATVLREEAQRLRAESLRHRKLSGRLRLSWVLPEIS